jgi:hypothetical protein
MRLNAPGDAPPWATQLLRDVEKAIREARDAPLQVKAFASAAALPAAARWPNGVVRVVDINMLAFSDGTHGIRVDTGAAL